VAEEGPTIATAETVCDFMIQNVCLEAGDKVVVEIAGIGIPRHFCARHQIQIPKADKVCTPGTLYGRLDVLFDYFCS
jgi:hypothetical protein